MNMLPFKEPWREKSSVEFTLKLNSNIIKVHKTVIQIDIKYHNLFSVSGD